MAQGRAVAPKTKKQLLLSLGICKWHLTFVPTNCIIKLIIIIIIILLLSSPLPLLLLIMIMIIFITVIKGPRPTLLPAFHWLSSPSAPKIRMSGFSLYSPICLHGEHTENFTTTTTTNNNNNTVFPRDIVCPKNIKYPV